MLNEPTSELVKRGIDLCRLEHWNEGLDCLAQVFNAHQRPSGELPSLMLSYLGYAIARQGRKKEGLVLCEQAVRAEFYQVENLYNLARTALLLDDRRKAMGALDKALQIDANHGPSRDLRSEIGRRRPPVLGFLDRDHALNRLLGRLRHGITAKRSS
jgi:tetratricopeptide (TPR) repeat protein